MIFKVTILYLLLMISLINLTQARFTEVPAPPKRPDHFRSKEELIRYVQKVHEYHSITGRWRLRRSYDKHPYLSTSNDDLFEFFDMNNDHHISQDEFSQRLKLKNENQ